MRGDPDLVSMLLPWNIDGGYQTKVTTPSIFVKWIRSWSLKGTWPGFLPIQMVLIFVKMILKYFRASKMAQQIQALAAKADDLS